MTLYQTLVTAAPALAPSLPAFLVEYAKMRPGPDKRDAWRRIRLSVEYDRYVSQKSEAELHNYTTIIWLAKYREENDLSLMECMAIEKKIKEFIGAVGDQRDVYPCYRLDYKKLKINHFEGGA